MSAALAVVLACLLGTPGVGVRPPSMDASALTKRFDGEVGNLTAVIDGPGPTADVGVPFTLSASLGDAIGPFVYIWNCAALGTTFTPTWTVRLLSAGAERFTLEVGDAAGGVAWANLSVNATAEPHLSVAPLNRSADAGVPLGVALNVSEGVPPYRVAWAVAGGPSRGAVNLSSPGIVDEPVWTNTTGPVWLTANVTDAVGGSDSAAAWVSLASAAPSLALALPTSVGEVGVPLRLSAAVLGGVPPIAWTFGALGTDSNVTASHGVLAGPGSVAWNATPAVPGNLTVWITTVDSVGLVRFANATLLVVAPVNASLVVLNRSLAAGAPLNLSGLVGGGRAPYTIAWAASDGLRGTGVLVEPGPVNWSVPAAPSGFLTVTLTVRDAAGGTCATVATAFASPAPAAPAPPPSGAPSDVLGGVVGLGLGGGAIAGGLWWWNDRRRRRTHDALERRTRADRFVAEAIRSRHGIDADDLQGLGDAQSLFSEEVAEAVDRLMASGQVRAEYETGDPVYYWGTETTERGATPELEPEAGEVP